MGLPPKPPAPRVPWWKFRLRVLIWIVGGLGALAFVAWFLFFRMPGTSWQGPVPAPGEGLAPLREELRDVVFSLSRTIGERSLGRPDRLEAAAAYVEGRFRAAGLTPRRETYASRWGALSNVIAEVPGTTHAGEIVVVGAHYDSVEGSPGANDNATGVAATLALARRFATAKPLRTLRFVAFVGEEPPAFTTPEMGSYVHAKGCRQRGEHVAAMLALETLGCYRDDAGSQRYPVRGLSLLYGDRADFVAFVGDVGSGGLVRSAIGAFRGAATIRSEGAALPMSIPGIGWSDHWSFRQFEFPAAMVTDTAVFRDPAYHDSADQPERVDFHRVSLVVAGLERVVELLANPKD